MLFAKTEHFVAQRALRQRADNLQIQLSRSERDI